MLVKALVRSISENSDAQKPQAIVTLEVANPLEIIQVRLFKNSYADGTVSNFKQVIGAEMDIPLQAEIYNGKISWNLPFGEKLQLPARPAAKAVASA
ncbi:MAG: hypothetical protein JWM78_458 [Verrucomicrobiaceae bacterium]|nr:hypothetical protein [Verrucomicrobiaceae bacterium]